MYKVIGQILNGSSTVSLVPLCSAIHAARPRANGGPHPSALPPEPARDPTARLANALAESERAARKKRV